MERFLKIRLNWTRKKKPPSADLSCWPATFRMITYIFRSVKKRKWFSLRYWLILGKVNFFFKALVSRTVKLYRERFWNGNHLVPNDFQPMISLVQTILNRRREQTENPVVVVCRYLYPYLLSKDWSPFIYIH